MKRRTNRKSAHNAAEHRAAFEHAVRVYGKLVKKTHRSARPTHSRTHRRIRFYVDLELEKGGTIEIEFSCTKGFRFEMEGMLWQEILPKNPDSPRHLPQRLDAYRRKLHSFYTAGQAPITFRHFNLLLAALSYDLAANPSPVTVTTN